MWSQHQQEKHVSEKEQGVLVSVDVFNAITEYLSNRPYREVNQIIDEIRSTTKMIEIPQEEEEQSDD